MLYDLECLLLWLDLLATHPSTSLIRKTFPIQYYNMSESSLSAFSVIWRAKLYPCVCACFGKGGRMIVFIPQDCKVINSKCPSCEFTLLCFIESRCLP